MKTITRFILFTFISTYIIGCTGKDLYQAIENHNRHDCGKIKIHTQYEECMARTNSNRFERKR